MVKFYRTPNFVRKIFPNRIWGFSSAEKTIYLTFDDGPTKELTNWILDELKSQNVKATFFCVGSNAKLHPELMQKMIDQGHSIGNHTMEHNKGTSTNKQTYLSSIDECSKYVKSKLFRPPYGRLYSTWDKEITEKYKIVMWSWLSYDYDVTIPIEVILQKATDQIENGDILVLHDNLKVEHRIQELLPKLIQLLKQKGYRFARIEQDI